MPHKTGHPPRYAVVIVNCVPRGRGSEVIKAQAYWTGKMWRGALGFKMHGYRVVSWEKK